MVKQLNLDVLGDAMVQVDGHVAGVLRHPVRHVLVLDGHGAEVPPAHTEEHLGLREHLVGEREECGVRGIRGVILGCFVFKRMKERRWLGRNKTRTESW